MAATGAAMTAERRCPRAPAKRWCASNSRHAQLLLQARRRGSVLKHQLLLRIDVAVRFLRHQRALVESREDQLELAGIRIDVADREQARDVGLEGACVHGNEL